MFHTSSDDDIRSGRVTDVYFARTLEVLKAKGIDKRVRAEFIAKSLPLDWGWGVLAGIEEVARLMEGRAINIRGMQEGEVFGVWEPVIEVEGMYQEFCVFETAMLGLLCQASGVATASARTRIAAKEKPVVSFGARRMHPAIAPMIERAAYIGGCDGVAVVASAELIGIPATGTMPHALILVIGDTVEATRAFDDVMDPAVKRVALIDTFNDEKFEALRVAEAMGERLHAVRLDTPGSRRGDFARIFEEVRWELDLRGYGHVKLFASGGLDERTVAGLSKVVDAFGVGTSISNAPVVDFSMDIVEIEGVPSAKRGKRSGAKDVTRCVVCGLRRVLPLEGGARECPCGGGLVSLLSPLITGGVISRELPRAKAIREYCLERIAGLEL
jgi:nicotinate phosphoribosyltransferase